MPQLEENWDPHEWEIHVFGLLQDRHGPLNVSKVPARHKGDQGLDYYTLIDQAAYQCYAVQEPCDVALRAEKQKVKITIDIGKFCQNGTALKRLFGAVQMRRWILVVPLHDSSQVNAHATSKTAEVRALGLSYTAEDFEVMIQDLQSFDTGSRAARALQRRSLSIPRTLPSPEQVDAWSAASNHLVNTLAAKLQKRVTADAPGSLEEDVSEAVGWFLECGNALETVRGYAPELYEALVEVISRHAGRLRLYGPPSEGAPDQILRQELESLVAELRASVPHLSLASADQLARGTLVDWLMRCPLDFPPYTQST